MLISDHFEETETTTRISQTTSPNLYGVRDPLFSSVDTTVTPSSDLDPCPLTSADPLGILATVASLQGQGHFSLPSTDDGSLDILAAAALFAGVCTETSDSVSTIPSVPTSDEIRGVKRKRENEDEIVSLEDDLYLSESDTDDDNDSDGDDADDEEDSEDDDFFDISFRTADDTDSADETIGEESFKTFYDSDDDDEPDSTDTASDSSGSDSGEGSDSEDDDDDDDVDCPASCVCRTGRYMQLPPMARRCKVISPLYKKLMKRRLLRFVNQSKFECCERRCSLRWRKMSKYRVTSDYEPTDLRVYHFRWGTWKPEDEYDDIW